MQIGGTFATHNGPSAAAGMRTGCNSGFRTGPLHSGQSCHGGILGMFADILISTAAQYQRCFQARAAAAGHRERPRAPAAGDAASECAALKVDSEMAAQEPCDEILISRERTQYSIS